MNTNIQNLIKSFSPEKRKEIQDYVINNMSAEIRAATLHGSVTPDMQQDLEKIIIQYLEVHYPDDIKHTITQAKDEVEEQINDLVSKQLDLMASQPVEDISQNQNAVEAVVPVQEEPVVEEKQYNGFLINMGAKTRPMATVIPPQQTQTAQVVSPTQQITTPPVIQHTQVQAEVTQPQQPVPVAAPAPIPVVQQEQVDLYDSNDDENILGENTGYEQKHDRDNRIFGIQRKIYKLLALTDDDTSESYFRIVMVISGIMIFLGMWNLFNDFTTISSMKAFYYEKNGIYMRQLADFCQTSMSNIRQFQMCISDRQAELILNRRIDAVKDFLVIAAGFVILFISYFLKLNYRGRDAYLNREDY